MITKVNVERQDVEDTIDSALAEFKDGHSRQPHYLVLGRLAYEELRDMLIIGHRNEGLPTATTYKGLEVAVVEDPSNLLSIGCKPD